jgi:hypothetical protein
MMPLLADVYARVLANGLAERSAAEGLDTSQSRTGDTHDHTLTFLLTSPRSTFDSTSHQHQLRPKQDESVRVRPSTCLKS